jgi:hypothetical protein
MSFIKPAAEKLPLAVRKDVRDNFEAKKEDLLKELSDLLGRPYTVNFDANEVFPYTKVDGFGKSLHGYLEGVVSGVRDLIEKYPRDGAQHFNDAVHKSEIALHVNPNGNGEVIDCEIKDGVFVILFRHDDCFGYNLGNVGGYMQKRIDEVPRDDFPLLVKGSLQKHYEPEFEKIKAEVAEVLAMPDVVLDSNLKECCDKLQAAGNKATRAWGENFGEVFIHYFGKGLLEQLRDQGFPKDDMLQEGLAEVLTSKTFKVRVVDKLVKGSVNETILEDGVCYLQTTPDNWGYNYNSMGAKLVDML